VDEVIDSINVPSLMNQLIEQSLPLMDEVIDLGIGVIDLALSPYPAMTLTPVMIIHYLRRSLLNRSELISF
jgi:hypothetical protein